MAVLVDKALINRLKCSLNTRKLRVLTCLCFISPVLVSVEISSSDEE